MADTLTKVPKKKKKRRKARDPEVVLKSRIRSKLRQLWFYSYLRRQAVERDGGKCAECGDDPKSPCAHHTDMSIGWDKIFDVLFNGEHALFCPSDKLECLCKECHAKVHGKTLKKKTVSSKKG